MSVGALPPEEPRSAHTEDEEATDNETDVFVVHEAEDPGDGIDESDAYVVFDAAGEEEQPANSEPPKEGSQPVEEER